MNATTWNSGRLSVLLPMAAVPMAVEFASYPRILAGRVPGFLGTPKARRLPDVFPTALHFPRLAVAYSVYFAAAGAKQRTWGWFSGLWIVCDWRAGGRSGGRNDNDGRIAQTSTVNTSSWLCGLQVIPIGVGLLISVGRTLLDRTVLAIL